MKSTGVVRRIDDLGRIVIPKEIRKTMRIKDGESLEIFLENDNIILKKYSDFVGLTDFYNLYVSSINSVINANVLISDRNKVVSCAGEIKKQYLNKDISSFVEKVIQERSIVFSKDIVNLAIISDSKDDFSYVIAPIIAYGDAIGAIMILSSDHVIDDNDIKIVTIASKFLSKYIE